ncbi:amidohydrolase family protein [Sandarakinorhabdus oryzae]|uniref:amidohydrolase family protein n=1 Tax=Sandarakinorhabdus oryzae TaxID=2675220 RepID=UPI0012E30602|nr:amidohydrolase family protein [Sandarakinorhabdus oryzae]
MKRLAITLLLAGAPLPAAAAPVAITGATIMTARGETVIDGGTLVFDNGRITAVGKDVAVPAGATVIDGKGRILTPGIIAATSDLGISEVNGVRETNDGSARQSPFSAALDLSTAINPRSIHIAISRMAGVTRAAALPDSAGSIFGGQGALISLSASGATLTRARALQYMELGETGGRIAGGSRPAAFAQLANMLAEAQRLALNPAAFDRGQDSGSLAKRLDAEALAPVIDGRQPLFVHVERASDIQELLKLKARYPALRPVLVGAREAWLVAGEIARAGVPVITHSLYDLPDDFESLAASRNNLGVLQAAGVTVAIAPLGGIGGTSPVNLPSYAGNAVAQGLVPGGKGLTRAQALAAITANPARILGLADTGTLEVGKRADLVLWDGDPLELMSAPVAVWIDGAAQPMTSRQSELAQRYKALGRTDLPLQYPR